MNKSLRNFVALTLALFGLMLGKACVKEPENAQKEKKVDAKKDNKELRKLNEDIVKKANGVTRYKVLVNDSMPMKGKKDALITVVEFSDFQCPFCKRVEPVLEKLNEDFNGEIRIFWMNNPLSFHKDAMPAAEASYAIYKLKGTEAFWKAQKAFFSDNRNLTPELFTKTAKELGVDMEKFEEAMKNHTYQSAIKAQQAVAMQFGARGTPSFFINGSLVSGALPYSKFKEKMQEEFDYAKAVLEKTKDRANLYNEIIKDGLTKPKPIKRDPTEMIRRRPSEPDPSKVYYNNIENAPMKGAKDALVTIVQYSDFQCPFCKRVEPTMDKLLEEYKGKIKVVWKNFPLGFHKNAMPAAEAAQAIYELKGDAAFWKAHKIFFDNNSNLNSELYTKTAKDLGVDMAKFEKAMKDHTYQGAVKKQMSEGSLVGTMGTPASYINGRFLSGAQPYDVFKNLVEEELKKAEALNKKGTKKDEIYNTIMKNAEKKLTAAAPTIQPRRDIKPMVRPGSPDPSKAYYNNIENAPMKGAKDALVTIVQYSDFQCPFCKRVEPTMDKLLEEYKGKIKVVWKNFPLGFHRNAMPAAEAAQAIYELKGDAAFWKAHKIFFDNNGNLNSELYTKTAKDLGVDMAKFEKAMKDHTYQGAVKKQMSEGSLVGTMGTPASYINGRFLSGAQPYDRFKSLVEEEIKKAEALNKKGVKKSKIYETIMKGAEKKVAAAPVVRDPSEPDPSKAYYNNIENAPMKGTKDALVTIVQYSDFQCPFCKRVEPTMDKLLEDYKGKIKVVWKNFPLGFHRNAMPAAEAAQAIYELKGDAAFWKAHKIFFDNNGNLNSELYTKTAKDLGVNMAKFEKAMKDHKYQATVKKQMSEGTLVGTRGTPASYINGRFLSGAQPYDSFKSLVEEELKKAEALNKKGVKKSKIYETIMKGASKSLR